jgi:hypothetical protein
MGINKIHILKSGLFSYAIIFAVTLFFIFISTGVTAADRVVTQETLLDRIQIEDMIVRYYVDMSAGKSHDLPCTIQRMLFLM